MEAFGVSVPTALPGAQTEARFLQAPPCPPDSSLAWAWGPLLWGVGCGAGHCLEGRGFLGSAAASGGPPRVRWASVLPRALWALAAPSGARVREPLGTLGCQGSAGFLLPRGPSSLQGLAGVGVACAQGTGQLDLVPVPSRRGTRNGVCVTQTGPPAFLPPAVQPQAAQVTTLSPSHRPAGSLDRAVLEHVPGGREFSPGSSGRACGAAALCPVWGKGETQGALGTGAPGPVALLSARCSLSPPFPRGGPPAANWKVLESGDQQPRSRPRTGLSAGGRPAAGPGLWRGRPCGGSLSGDSRWAGWPSRPDTRPFPRGQVATALPAVSIHLLSTHPRPSLPSRTARAGGAPEKLLPPALIQTPG